jgi:hypothetical protein
MAARTEDAPGSEAPDAAPESGDSGEDADEAGPDETAEGSAEATG